MYIFAENALQEILKMRQIVEDVALLDYDQSEKKEQDKSILEPFNYN